MSEFKEYITFVVSTKDGQEVEMAVIDQFEFENKGYVAAALLDVDTVSDEGCFIYRVKVGEDDFKVEKSPTRSTTTESQKHTWK